MPISTGTNNVFPTMVEGTLAGLAAGVVARGLTDGAVHRAPCLEVHRSGAPSVIALVDVAVYDERFVAARALWDAARIREVVLARLEPGSIGLSSIGAHLGLGSDNCGLYLRMGEHGQRVLAPIAPGLIASVSVAEYRVLASGEQVRVCPPRPCTLALDGEREVALSGASEVCIRFRSDGPRVVDMRLALSVAARTGIFVGPTWHADVPVDPAASV
jgi:hypothetical protein